jgi:hypothetical protein
MRRILFLQHRQSLNCKEESGLEEEDLVEAPPKVARVLKLVDEEEDLEAKQPLEASPRLVSKVSAPIEELKVEVIEAPLVRKRKLTKMAGAVTPEVEAVNVASFLAARRKQIPSPSVPLVANVEAFLANEPVKAVPVNGVELTLKEPLQVPRALFLQF